MTLENGLAAFLDAMLGKNRSSATLRGVQDRYPRQFIRFLHENNVGITDVDDVGKMGFQAFLAENLLCALEPLTLLSFRH